MNLLELAAVVVVRFAEEGPVSNHVNTAVAPRIAAQKPPSGQH
jgi:hypothetical protein